MIITNLNRFLAILFYFIIILGSPTVWSSDLEKIQNINKKFSLKNIDFFDYTKNKIDIIDNNTDFYILNFWASWCAPCIKEMKSLDNLKEMLSEIKVITVNQDSDIEDAISFFKKNKYENLEKFYDYNKLVSKNFSLRGLPTTFIFNSDLIAVAKVEGIIKWDSKEFKRWLKTK